MEGLSDRGSTPLTSTKIKGQDSKESCPLILDSVPQGGAPPQRISCCDSHRRVVESRQEILSSSIIARKMTTVGRIAYFNGTIGNYEEMTIPFSDRSVFYGDAVYDAVLVLDRKAFALELHLDRLYRSCAMTEIPFEMPREELKGEIDRLLDQSDMGSVMLYLQVTRGAAPRKHEYPVGVKPNLLMFTSPVSLPPKDKRASLLSMEDLRFQYCNIKTTNLLPNVFAAQKATGAGATEALLHRGGRVTEAAHSSILMIQDGTVVMPPLDELILPGITRAIIQQICEENAIPVDVRVFTVDELMGADEIILCSTTKSVLFVYEIDGRPVGGKDPALRRRIQELFAGKIWADTGVRV